MPHAIEPTTNGTTQTGENANGQTSGNTDRRASSGADNAPESPALQRFLAQPPSEEPYNPHYGERSGTASSDTGNGQS
ncbi:hypothetical protein BDV96DRAFT_651974 [Lophiotrema nucula]|uniref:Uncharacterized protein n=1 Tax=Lophiotrema nucula TaxID=690887 RepID=A0A6A5YRD6_9PLEO|nr:hypothetical protein BDV96DRAFT_651974 [Lophiotrema nucula]